MLLRVAAKQLLDDGPFRGLEFDARRITRAVRMHTIAVGGSVSV
jgi:hypothetical protein